MASRTGDYECNEKWVHSGEEGAGRLTVVTAKGSITHGEEETRRRAEAQAELERLVQRGP